MFGAGGKRIRNKKQRPCIISTCAVALDTLPAPDDDAAAAADAAAAGRMHSPPAAHVSALQDALHAGSAPAPTHKHTHANTHTHEQTYEQTTKHTSRYQQYAPVSTNNPCAQQPPSRMYSFVYLIF